MKRVLLIGDVKVIKKGKFYIVMSAIENKIFYKTKNKKTAFSKAVKLSNYSRNPKKLSAGKKVAIRVSKKLGVKLDKVSQRAWRKGTPAERKFARKQGWINPARARKPNVIYDRLLYIIAKKGKTSNFAGKKFVHKFNSPAKVYGLADGSLLIKGEKPLWRNFTYNLKTGRRS